VLWTASPQRRLAALNMLAQVPLDIAISDSLGYSVLQSCVVDDPDIVAAALRCGRLSVAIENIPQAGAVKWFAELIHARVSCPLNHPTRLHIHICSRSRLNDACRLFEICLQAAAALVVAGMADIVTAAAQGNRDGVLLHFIADPASVNQRDNRCDTLPDTCKHFLMCLYCFFFVERFDNSICSGRTPLHLSSVAGHLEVCHFLVEKGADVNANDSDLYDTRPFMIFHS
jgi:hypothetical protein